MAAVSHEVGTSITATMSHATMSHEVGTGGHATLSHACSHEHLTEYDILELFKPGAAVVMCKPICGVARTAHIKGGIATLASCVSVAINARCVIISKQISLTLIAAGSQEETVEEGNELREVQAAIAVLVKFKEKLVLELRRKWWLYEYV